MRDKKVKEAKKSSTSGNHGKGKKEQCHKIDQTILT